MAPLGGVDRYGRPMAQQAAAPTRDQPMNNPAYQAPQQNQPQQQNAQQGAQAPQPNQQQTGGMDPMGGMAQAGASMAQSFAPQGQTMKPYNGQNTGVSGGMQGNRYGGQYQFGGGATQQPTADLGSYLQNQGGGQPPQQAGPSPQQGTFDRTQFRDAYMKSGVNTTQGMADFVNQHQGDFGGGVQVQGKKGDIMMMPDGTRIDGVMGAGVGGGMAGPQWTGAQLGGAPQQMTLGGGPGASQNAMQGYQGGVKAGMNTGFTGTYAPQAGQGYTQGAAGAGPTGANAMGAQGGFGVQGGQFTYGGVAQPGAYKPGQLPTAALPTYNPGSVNQFGAPDQQQGEAGVNQLMQHLMQNPESMSPQVVAQMKAAQAEQANSGLNAQQQMLQQQAASRGMGGGGQADAALRRLGDTRNSQILQGGRDIDINAAQTNFNDRLNALGAGGQALTGQLGRGMDAYKTGLAGQMAQNDENFKGYNSQADATRYDLNRALSQEGLNQQGSNDAFSHWLSGAQLGEGGRQADMSNFLDQQRIGNQNSQYYAGLGQNQGQFNSNMDYNWQNAGQQNQANLFKTLFPNGING